MLEKSGTIVLTVDDINELNNGKVSERVSSTWNLTLQQLKEIVANNDYVPAASTRSAL